MLFVINCQLIPSYSIIPYGKFIPCSSYNFSAGFNESLGVIVFALSMSKADVSMHHYMLILMKPETR